jgi:hypothetical protein
MYIYLLCTCMADSAHVLIGRSRLFRYPIASFPQHSVRFQRLQDFDRRHSLFLHSIIHITTMTGIIDKITGNSNGA